PGTDVPSSYRAGREFQADLVAANAQAERHWQVDLGLHREADGAASLRFAPRDASGQALTGLEVTVRLGHPADPHHDHQVVLVEGRGGVYAGRLEAVTPGQWLVESEARRGGERLYLSRNRVVLR